MTRMQAQAEKFGAKVEVWHGRVGGPCGQAHPAGRRWRCRCETRTLIIASGAGHKHLGVPGEHELEKKGVTYCATCDGALPVFRNQPLVVVGGGDLRLRRGQLPHPL
jgi:thioredoxin reductase (NADPH)